MYMIEYVILREKVLWYTHRELRKTEKEAVEFANLLSKEVDETGERTHVSINVWDLNNTLYPMFVKWWN